MNALLGRGIYCSKFYSSNFIFISKDKDGNDIVTIEETKNISIETEELNTLSVTTTGTVIELDKDSLIYPLGNIRMEGAVKASFPMLSSEGQAEGDAAAKEAKAAEEAKKKAEEEEQRQQGLAAQEEKTSWKDKAKRITKGLAKVALGVGLAVLAVVAVPAPIGAAVAATTIAALVVFTAAAASLALTAAVYTPGLISEGTSDVELGIKGDLESKANNVVENTMDELMGEGAYENWDTT